MTLRIHIDGEWSAEEFSEFFYALQDLSYFLVADMELRFAPPAARSPSLASLRYQAAQLQVKKIRFASPGFTDLAGFGAVLSEIRQFIEFLIVHLSERENRKLDREAKKLEILETKIRLSRELLENSELPHEVAKLIEPGSSAALMEAIVDGRLKRTEIIEDDN